MFQIDDRKQARSEMSSTMRKPVFGVSDQVDFNRLLSFGN